MKRPAVFFLLLTFALSLSVSAHRGGTDSDGGHYDYETGDYHYHHGYPAHYHTDGKCPYDFRDNVDHDRNYYRSGDSEETTAFWESPEFQNGDEYDNYEYFRSLEETSIDEQTTEIEKTEPFKNNPDDITDNISFWIIGGILALVCGGYWVVVIARKFKNFFDD